MTLAAQVCAACKARKKKCDKTLPRCGFCVRKGLGCAYDDDSSSCTPSRAHQHVLPLARVSTFFLPLPRLNLPADMSGGPEANLYLQVQNFIHAAGLYVDDVSVGYFRGIHRYLPIISRTRFHNDLITLGATPSAGFSSLLLSICLISSCTALERPSEQTVRKPVLVDHDSLYLTATSLLAQIQALFPPSVYLVQAELLMAVYEHMTGRPDKAFASIVGCARMAYSARIHVCNEPSPLQPWQPIDGSTGRVYQLQNQEAANTWWGIIICERTLFCDVTVTEQPLVTISPGGATRLPIEPELLEQIDSFGIESITHIPVSYLSSVEVGSFGRAAQATWLLDQVIKAFEIINVDTQLFQLQGLDATLQSFLSALMQQCDGGQKLFCEAIAVTIRALFALHWHILDLFPGLLSERYQAVQDRYKSHAALDTTTKIVLDVVEAHENKKTCATSFVAPSYPYLIRAALKHIYKKAEWKKVPWLWSAEERLRTSLNRFVHHQRKFEGDWPLYQ